ncbi:head-tail adaptor protein [Phaeobacter sp. C3_T13_0]|uniref:phage head completion protein n=1 Tax=Phaeobacter cretensis TaxID=3342641 RepID=UPI0039BC68D2
MARSNKARNGQIARMRIRVAFDRPERGEPGEYGGYDTSFAEMRTCRAEVIYMRGSEAVEAARLQGRAVFKVKIRKMGSAADINSDWRMRTVGTGLPDGNGPDDDLPGARYNVREVDALSDKKWVYLIVESALL